MGSQRRAMLVMAVILGTVVGVRTSAADGGASGIELTAITVGPGGAWREFGTWRGYAAVIYDPLRRRMVMFGGTGIGSQYNEGVQVATLESQPQWEPLDVSGTGPGPRIWMCAVYDPVGDRMIGFGGRDSGSVVHNDAWALTLGENPTWTQLLASGTPPPARTGHTAIYDPVRHRIVVFGGWVNGVGLANDLWALSLSTMTWQQLAPTGSLPRIRSSHSAIYDAARDRMVVFGGNIDDYTEYATSDTWSLDFSGNHWTELSPAGGPPWKRAAHSAVYDSARDVMIIFGGGFDGSAQNTTWQLSLSGLVWTEVGLSPRPRARIGHAAVFDPMAGAMIVTGGVEAMFSGEGTLDGWWSLSSSASPTWTELVPSWSPPPGRTQPVMVYDPARDRILVQGGYSYETGWMNDTWELGLDGNPVWSRIWSTGQTPPARYGQTAVVDEARDRLVLYDGVAGSSADVRVMPLTGDPAWSILYAPGDTPSLRTGHTLVLDTVRDRLLMFGGTWDGVELGDLWALPLDGSTGWVRIGTDGPGRREHTAIYDPVGDRMIVYGGRVNNVHRSDVWELRLDPTPTWSPIMTAGEIPPARSLHSAIYDPARHRMVIYGGGSMGDVYEFIGDVWELSLDSTPTWTELAPPDPVPDGRAEHKAIYDPLRDQMVVYGGRNPYEATLKYMSETWSLFWGTPVLPGRLEGAVRDADTQQPLAGVSVEVLLGGQFQQATTTGADGAYAFDLVTGGYELRATASGYLRRTVPVAFPGGGDTTVDVALDSLFVADAAREPHHATHWAFDADHTIAWASGNATIDSVIVSFRQWESQPWRRIGRGTGSVNSLTWTAGAIPDTSTVTAQLLYEAYGNGGEWLGDAVTETFALHIDTGATTSLDNHVFVWDTVPEGTARFRVDLSHDGTTTCADEFTLSDFTDEAVPYHQLPAGAWETLAAAEWTCTVVALDETDTPLATVLSDRPFEVTRVENLTGGTEGVPVLLVHGWTDSAEMWDPATNQFAARLQTAGMDAWTFEYPPIGHIERSAGSLQRAIAAILARYPESSRIRIVAHSMGGLVSRAYIQGLGLSHEPVGDLTVPYRNDVARLVTLGTPHLGSQAWLAVGLSATFIRGDCRGQGGPAGDQLNNDFGTALPSLFLRTLNNLSGASGHPLDPVCNYLFVAGNRPSDFGSAVQTAFMRFLNPLGPSDGAVLRSSAWAEDVAGLTAYNVHTTQYCQDHTRLKNFTATERKTTEIIAYLSNGTLPSGDPSTLVQVGGAIKRGTQSGVASAKVTLKSWLGLDKAAGGDMGEIEASSDPVDEDIVALTGATGDYAFPFVPAGWYEIQVTAPGLVPQTAVLQLDPATPNPRWDAILASDPVFAGPLDPWVVIDGGAPATPDAGVTLAFGADGANEMMVSTDPGFAGATWQAFAPSLPWTLAGSAGQQVVFAKFRDSALRESSVVLDDIQVAGAETGSIAVGSSVAGASVTLNGLPVPGTTPTVYTGLAPGTYWVSASLPGYRPEPGQWAVQVSAGVQSDVQFVLTPQTAPSSFWLASPPPDTLVTARPDLAWQASTPPDSASTVSYTVQIARDAAFADMAFEVGGITGTHYALPVDLADSTHYAWRVRAVSIYGQSTTCVDPYRWLTVDGTPPTVAVVSPNGGEIWASGDTATVQWQATDDRALAAVAAEITIDGGATFTSLGAVVPGQTALAWAVPDSILRAYSSCRVRITAVDVAGNIVSDLSDGLFHIVDPVNDVPEDSPYRRYAIHQNVPNPFNPMTSIRFDLPMQTRVDLRVYDVSGRLVRTLIQGASCPAGRNEILWDGRDSLGRGVASGVYFCRLRADRFVGTRRMSLVK